MTAAGPPPPEPADAGADVDPELERQLREAAEAGDETAGSAPVEAVFVLRDPAGGDARRRVEDLVRRVESRTGERVHDLNVFSSLGSFVVVAGPKVVDLLTRQPEIGSAMANRRPSGTAPQPGS